MQMPYINYGQSIRPSVCLSVRLTLRPYQSDQFWPSSVFVFCGCT